MYVKLLYFNSQDSQINIFFKVPAWTLAVKLNSLRSQLQTLLKKNTSKSVSDALKIHVDGLFGHFIQQFQKPLPQTLICRFILEPTWRMPRGSPGTVTTEEALCSISRRQFTSHFQPFTCLKGATHMVIEWLSPATGWPHLRFIHESERLNTAWTIIQ